jgi:hypothetical protein
MRNIQKTPEYLKDLSAGDRREQDRLRLFSTLGLRPPRTKRERYALERLAKKMRGLK